MKFDCIVGNPPYVGNGNPLYMRITKVVYDNILQDNGIMSMIHPTAIVENNYTGNENYDRLKKEYGHLKLKYFYYENYLRDIFSAYIGNGIAVFVYSKKGDFTLFGEEIKTKRFGGDYSKDKEIVDIVSGKPTLGDYVGYKNINFGNKDKTKEFPKCNFYSVMACIRGNIDRKTGGKKWDWTTLQSEDYLEVKNELGNGVMNLFDFGDDFDSAKELIKWTCTDFVNFFVLFYKYQITNNSVLFRKIPQPPPNGDYSDKSLCEYFGLEQKHMDYIHNKVKDYGWKVYLKCTEQELMNKIDDINGKPERPNQEL